jgi:hypothetical protein
MAAEPVQPPQAPEDVGERDAEVEARVDEAEHDEWPAVAVRAVRWRLAQ